MGILGGGFSDDFRRPYLEGGQLDHNRPSRMPREGGVDPPEGLGQGGKMGEDRRGPGQGPPGPGDPFPAWVEGCRRIESRTFQLAGPAFWVRVAKDGAGHVEVRVLGRDGREYLVIDTHEGYLKVMALEGRMPQGEDPWAWGR